jgi:signal transduction histidine kinase/CheY-like chemotaxis protein
VTGATGKMVVVVLGLLAVLTYLLLRGSTPDAELHERRLRAIDVLTLNQAALQRDVLRASNRLLLNYDPIVAAVERLRNSAGELRTSGAARDVSAPIMDSIVEGLDEQERLIENFKSAHALLHNSVAHFANVSGRLGTLADKGGQTVAMIVGRLANRMYRFVGSSSDTAEASKITVLLTELSAVTVPAGLRDDIVALRAHGELILTTLPEVDRILARLLATRISEQAHALQDLFMKKHRRAETIAWVFRGLLYLASVLLLIYLIDLYGRLRANARALRARSDFEHLIAGISAQLIDTPLHRTGQGILQGLEQLGRHAGVDRVYIVLHSVDDAMAAQSHIWCREGMDAPDGWPDGALAITASWNPKDYERYGCVDVSSVQGLPWSEVKSQLIERDIRSWLCVPLWHAGNRVGLLGFDGVEREKRWADDDIVLLRTIGEIFANALRRERAERERRTLESRSRHAQRMEALGTLAGGIAHDFNNILGAILGYAEMALGRLRRDSREWHDVQEVRKAGERAREIADRILAFGRRTEQQHRPVRMRPLLKETASLLRASLPPTVNLRMRLPDEEAIVQGDASRLQQVIMNLVNNAAQAMNGGGVIDVTLAPVAIDTDKGLSHGTLGAGRYARLTVRDSGHGMDAATLERIFEPFFTTKSVGVGTGLGLAMVHGIVGDHGGAINVRSRPGAGSTFEAYFRQAEFVPMSNDDDSTPMPFGRGETILIVDNEKPLMLLVEEMVAAVGYEPVGFESGTSALAAFRADPKRFDLVLADEVMPGMTGSELAAALHAIQPRLPIILMSGYSGLVDSPRQRSGVREVLKKPLLSADIAGAIARHLDRGARLTAGAVGR